MNNEIIILVFTSGTVPKYKHEIHNVEETWGHHAKSLGVNVLFFLGEEPTDLIGPQYIYLKGVNNDYISASYKQNLGFKYINEHYNPHFVFCCGCDTYVNIDKILDVVSSFDYQEKLYIGGHTDTRLMGNQDVLYHSRGGFIISNGFLKSLSDAYDHMTADWIQLCKRNNVQYLEVACDVCIGFYASLQKCHTIILDHMFTGCDYKGTQCRTLPYIPWIHHPLNLSQLVSCHYMTGKISTDFHDLLTRQHYYVDSLYGHQHVPDCTLILSSFDNNIISDIILRTACYQVIFGDQQNILKIRTTRRQYGLNEMTMYYQLPSKEVSDLELFSNACHINHFRTSRFAWIAHDVLINGNEKSNDLLRVLNYKTDKFHVKIVDIDNGYPVLDFRMILCEKKIGYKVFDYLTNSSIKTLKYQLLSEFPDQISCSYGSPIFQLNNFLSPTCDSVYIYNNILSKYLTMELYHDCYSCAKTLLDAIDTNQLDVAPDYYMKILMCYYTSSTHCHPDVTEVISQQINDLCMENSALRNIRFTHDSRSVKI